MPEVRFDSDALIVADDVIRWSEIIYIAFVTTSRGPCSDDQFLVFRSRTHNETTVSLEWPGAGDLLGLVATLDESESPDWLCKRWTTDKTTIVWPPRSATDAADLPAAVGNAIVRGEESPRLKLSDLPDPQEFADRLAKRFIDPVWYKVVLVPIVIGLICIVAGFLALALMELCR